MENNFNRLCMRSNFKRLFLVRVCVKDGFVAGLFGRRHGPISRSWRLAGLICFFLKFKVSVEGAWAVCVACRMARIRCAYVCVPVPIQPNSLPFFFLDNLVWNIYIYIYILYYMYIYVYRIYIYIYILLFSSVLHNSLYVKFHLFQPQDAWLHEFGDPKADSGLCVHFCFCWLGPLLKCFLFGFWVQCFFPDCLAILLLITFPCFSGFRPIKATKMIRRRQLTWSTSLCICFWCANC